MSSRSRTPSGGLGTGAIALREPMGGRPSRRAHSWMLTDEKQLVPAIPPWEAGSGDREERLLDPTAAALALKLGLQVGALVLTARPVWCSVAGRRLLLPSATTPRSASEQAAAGLQRNISEQAKTETRTAWSRRRRDRTSCTPTRHSSHRPTGS